MVSASALWFPIRETARGPEPPPSPHWRFWGTFLWSTLIAVVFLVTQILVITIEIVLSPHGEYTKHYFLEQLIYASHSGNVLAHATFASTAVCCSLIAFVIKLKKGSTLKDYLCLYRVQIKTVASWLGATLLVFVLSCLILYLLDRPMHVQWVFAVYTSAQPRWVLWVALLIAGPLFEEVFFRGFMFKGLQSSFLGPIGATIITASIWAAIHV